ncbi:DUF6585 family protein [Pseudactinotalea suaedae]|uniref:DUF6585 family protein n=1 Tax=Pseudactinotalea suaedae TaxID=1524924 RepID=UPI0012E18B3B|nr:DUF6585 family protein [Pseudactinotalea suaedae]
MSVPPQPNADSPSTSPAPQKDGGAKFGATPVAAFATLAVVTVGGAVTYVLTASATVTATCGGDRMRPGDLCETTRNGIRTGTDTYAEVLANAIRTNQVAQWVGIALVVIGVAFGVMTYLRWRQDVALRAQLGHEYGQPISAHSRTASSSFFGIIFGAGFVGLAGFFLLSGLSKDEWPYYLGTVFFGLLGLVFLSLAIPKNGQLIQTFADGVRIVTGNRHHALPWRDVDYVITPAKNAANHGISGPGLKQVVLTGLQDATDLQALVQQRTVEAKYRPAIEALNRGETVPFGSLAVSREGITAGRKLLPWNEFGGVTLHQGNVGVARVPQGRFAGVSLANVPNYALFVHLTSAISQQQPR